MRIGELERLTGVTRHTLRYYEDRGLLPAVRRHANGYRDYPPETVEQVQFIRDAQAMGFSLEEITRVLEAMREDSIDCEDAVALIEDKLAEVDKKVAELERLRQRLLKEKVRFEASAAQRRKARKSS